MSTDDLMKTGQIESVASSPVVLSGDADRRAVKWQAEEGKSFCLTF
jgi:hypothetical protein